MAINFGLAEAPAGPLDILRAAGQAQMQKLQAQTAQQEYQLRQQQIGDQQTVRAATQQAIKPDGTLDYAPIRQAYAQTGNIEGIQQLAAQQRTSQLQQIANVKAAHDSVVQALGGVNDQATYDAAIQHARQQYAPLGVDVDALGLPAQYDPGTVQKLQMSALDTKGQLDFHQKEVEEQGKNTRFTQGQEGDDRRQQASLSVMMRGQDRAAADAAAGRNVTLSVARMTDARDREKIAISRDPTSKPLTEAQSKATSYYLRAKQSERDLAAVGKAPPPGGAAQFADTLPYGVGARMMSDKDNQQLTARRGFVAAVLRQESGAAIGPSEFESYNKLYFPQKGDSATVVANKARLRDQATQGLKIEAGGGASQADAILTRPTGAQVPGGGNLRVVGIQRGK